MHLPGDNELIDVLFFIPGEFIMFQVAGLHPGKLGEWQIQFQILYQQDLRTSQIYLITV